MKEPMSATVLVATEGDTIATLIRQQLRAEFPRLVTATDAAKATQEFERHQPDLLVLAFRAVDDSLACCAELNAAGLRLNAHRTILLCHRDEMQRSYELCRDGTVDDYVQFWPETDDNKRLLMSLHRSLRELAAINAARQEHPVANASAAADESAPTDPDEAERSGPGTERAERESRAGDATAKSGKAHLDQARRKALAALGSAKARSNGSGQSGPVVLMIDDNPFQHKVVRNVLEKERYNFMFAASGTEALSILREMQPSLILLDVVMPEMDGLETLARLRELPGLATVPVIMLTGQSDMVTVTDSLFGGAVDFIVKPFKPATLILKMSRALGATA